MLNVIDPARIETIVAPPDDEGKRAMRVDDNGKGHRTCVALAGKIGAEVSCQIYGCRPQVCQDFRVYSDACLRAREREGIQA